MAAGKAQIALHPEAIISFGLFVTPIRTMTMHPLRAASRTARSIPFETVSTNLDGPLKNPTAPGRSSQNVSVNPRPRTHTIETPADLSVCGIMWSATHNVRFRVLGRFDNNPILRISYCKPIENE